VSYLLRKVYRQVEEASWSRHGGGWIGELLTDSAAELQGLLAEATPDPAKVTAAISRAQTLLQICRELSGQHRSGGLQ